MSELTQEIQAVRSAAADLEKQGYAVTVEPDPSEIPFDLNQYRPSILATRGKENLLIDVKVRGAHRSIDRYQQIAEIVGVHKNWRFMLSTVEALEPINRVTGEGPADPQSLKKMLDRVEPLLEGDSYDLVLPYLWSVYISAMRITGGRYNIPVDATSDRSVLKAMYSLGEIDIDEYKMAQQFLSARNRAVHSLDIDISRESVLDMYSHTKRRLFEWELIESL